MPKKPKNTSVRSNICLVLDVSSSMCDIIDDVRRMANDLIGTIKEANPNAIVGVVTFASKPSVIVQPTYAKNVLITQLSAYGNTALFDAIGEATTLIDTGDENDSHLVMILTDGEENWSLKYNAKTICDLLNNKQAEGNWTFTFQLPPGASKGFASKFGIPIENCREWEATRKGVEETEKVTSRGLRNYLAANAVGERAVKTFFVNTDLSKVKTKDLQKSLKDVSNDYKLYEVGQESRVDEFVSSKTKKDYVIGSSYYQLSKKEKVQPNKAVLIQDKKSKAIYGGDNARALIGLPTDGVSHAEVEPMDHGPYDVFIMSTSVNRKLPRGTKVLVNPNFTKGMKPTWDHTAV